MYGDQLNDEAGDFLFFGFLLFSELIQIAIGWLILKFFNGRR